MRTIIAKAGTRVETTVEATRDELDDVPDYALRLADRVRVTDEGRLFEVETDYFRGDVYFRELAE